MEITTNEYSVKYDAETSTVYWQGIMRLDRKQYEPISRLLHEVVSLKPSWMIMDLRNLDALNSSGISMLGRFISSLENGKNLPVVIQGAKEIYWQEKWIDIFQQVMPSLKLEW